MPLQLLTLVSWQLSKNNKKLSHKYENTTWVKLSQKLLLFVSKKILKSRKTYEQYLITKRL